MVTTSSTVGSTTDPAASSTSASTTTGEAIPASSATTPTTGATTTIASSTVATSATTATTTGPTVAAGLPTPADVALQYDNLCLQTDSRELVEKWFDPAVLDELNRRPSTDLPVGQQRVRNGWLDTACGRSGSFDSDRAGGVQVPSPDMKRVPITKVMTAEPSTIQRGQPLSEAYDLLQNAPFHHLPVLDGDTPVGMLASTDILRLVYDVDATDDRTLRLMLDHQFTIDDAMSDKLTALKHDATVKDAAVALRDGTIHSVLVLDDGDELVGIVTTTDLVSFLLDQFR
ncbi:MAG: HPP family protein [Acidimicrobiales bacterium]